MDNKEKRLLNEIHGMKSLMNYLDGDVIKEGFGGEEKSPYDITASQDAEKAIDKMFNGNDEQQAFKRINNAKEQIEFVVQLAAKGNFQSPILRKASLALEKLANNIQKQGGDEMGGDEMGGEESPMSEGEVIEEDLAEAEEKINAEKMMMDMAKILKLDLSLMPGLLISIGEHWKNNTQQIKDKFKSEVKPDNNDNNG